MSGASNELVIHEQRSSNGGVAVASSVLGEGAHGVVVFDGYGQALKRLI